MRINTTFSETAIQTAPEVCAVLLEDFLAICERPDGDAEQFEAALVDVARRFGASVAPRIGGVPRLSDEDELVEYLREIQPEVERLLAEPGAEFETVEPSAELTGDYEAVTTYFRQQLVVAKRITAAAERSDITLYAGFFRSPEWLRSGSAADSANGDSTSSGRGSNSPSERRGR